MKNYLVYFYSDKNTFICSKQVKAFSVNDATNIAELSLSKNDDLVIHSMICKDLEKQ